MKCWKCTCLSREPEQASAEFAFVDFAAFEGRSLSDLLTEWIDIPYYATSVASSFAGILASGGLILIYLVFFFSSRVISATRFLLVANPEKESEVQQIIAQIRDDIQKYMSIKLLTSSLTGLASYLYLLAVGVVSAVGAAYILTEFYSNGRLNRRYPVSSADRARPIGRLWPVRAGAAGHWRAANLHWEYSRAPAYGFVIQSQPRRYPADLALECNLGDSGNVSVCSFPHHSHDSSQSFPANPLDRDYVVQ